MKASIVVRVQSLHRHRSQSDRDICHDHHLDGHGEIYRRVFWLFFFNKACVDFDDDK